MSHLLRRYQDAINQDYGISPTVTEKFVKTFNRFMLEEWPLLTMEAINMTAAIAEYAAPACITMEDLTAIFKYVSETITSFPNIVNDVYLLMIPKDLEDDGTYSSVLFTMMDRTTFFDHMKTKYNLTPDEIILSQDRRFNSLNTALDHLDEFMVVPKEPQVLNKPISIARTKKEYPSTNSYFIPVPLSECISQFTTIDISLVKSYYESK